MTILLTTMPEITSQSTFALDDGSNGHEDRFHTESHDTVARILPGNIESKVDEQTLPPDRGTEAWLQVLGSWMLFLLVAQKNLAVNERSADFVACSNTWGILNTYANESIRFALSNTNKFTALGCFRHIMNRDHYSVRPRQTFLGLVLFKLSPCSQLGLS
jgi:hypothetical protein